MPFALQDARGLVETLATAYHGNACDEIDRS